MRGSTACDIQSRLFPPIVREPLLKGTTVRRRTDTVKGRSTNMDPFLLLGSLAVVIGIVGVVVLIKGRKKKVR